MSFILHTVAFLGVSGAVQMVISASQIQWTADCEKALDKGDKKGLKSLKKKQVRGSRWRTHFETERETKRERGRERERERERMK